MTFVLPTTSEFAGTHDMVIKATTSISTFSYLKVSLTIIETCNTEKVSLLTINAITSTITMRDTHLPEDLDIDLTKHMVSNKPL